MQKKFTKKYRIFKKSALTVLSKQDISVCNTGFPQHSITCYFMTIMCIIKNIISFQFSLDYLFTISPHLSQADLCFYTTIYLTFSEIIISVVVIYYIQQKLIEQYIFKGENDFVYSTLSVTSASYTVSFHTIKIEFTIGILLHIQKPISEYYNCNTKYHI